MWTSVPALHHQRRSTLRAGFLLCMGVGILLASPSSALPSAAAPTPAPVRRAAPAVSTPRSPTAGMLLIRPTADRVCVRISAGRGESTACTRSDSDVPAIVVTGATTEAAAHVVILDPSSRAAAMKLLINGAWQHVPIRDDGWLSATVPSVPDHIAVLDADGNVVHSDRPRARVLHMEETAHHPHIGPNH